MSEIAYTVAATFTDTTVAEAWLGRLRMGHIAEVLAGGATRAEIVALDGPGHAYEIHYRFPSREAFARYELECAPRLRAEGMSLFPHERGVTYRRSVGVVRDAFP
jgi:hypothetical protein